MKGEIGVWEETTEKKNQVAGGMSGGSNKRGEEGSKVED